MHFVYELYPKYPLFIYYHLFGEQLIDSDLILG